MNFWFCFSWTFCQTRTTFVVSFWLLRRMRMNLWILCRQIVAAVAWRQIWGRFHCWERRKRRTHYCFRLDGQRTTLLVERMKRVPWWPELGSFCRPWTELRQWCCWRKNFLDFYLIFCIVSFLGLGRASSLADLTRKFAIGDFSSNSKLLQVTISNLPTGFFTHKVC